MDKVCLIYNYAQHYRTSIFRLIDSEYNCSWYFGDSMSDVKKMDYSLLNGDVHESHTYRFGSLSFQRGVIGLLHKNYSHYLILPDTHSISSWLFLILSKFHRKKKVYIWTHGWYGKESKIERFLKHILYKLPNGGIFLYGNYAKNLMIKEGFDPACMFVIHNSLAYEKQLTLRSQLNSTRIFKNHFRNDNRNLIFIGRLTSVKKLDMILLAIDNCNRQGHRFNITFIGDGPEKHNLQNCVEALNLSTQVWFYGACYDETVIGELIYNADLCISPGNVGLTAIHAMVFGTPVMTHNDFKHQMPEFEAIKEGVTGDFFNANDVESLTHKIIQWFQSDGKNRESVREACFKEIDTEWTPQFQLSVLKENFK